MDQKIGRCAVILWIDKQCPIIGQLRTKDRRFNEKGSDNSLQIVHRFCISPFAACYSHTESTFISSRPFFVLYIIRVRSFLFIVCHQFLLSIFNYTNCVFCSPKRHTYPKQSRFISFLAVSRECFLFQRHYIHSIGRTKRTRTLVIVKLTQFFIV